jgi:hypothetical protein
MSWKNELLVIARFPVYETISDFKWRKWLTKLELRKDYEGRKPDPNEAPVKKQNLYKGIELTLLPASLTDEGLHCVRAFRYWNTDEASGHQFASVMFVFSHEGEEYYSGSLAFQSLCKRRVFRRGALYAGTEEKPESLVLHAPRSVYADKQRGIIGL